MGKNAKLFLFLMLVAIGVELLVISPKYLLDESPDGDRKKIPSTKIQIEESDNSSADQFMTKVHITGSREEMREWELWSDKAEGVKEQNIWLLKVVRALFFSRAGVTFNVTGERGRVHLVSKDVKIEGNVRTTSSNGYVFDTETVTYNSSVKKLEGPKRVSVTGPEGLGGGRVALAGDRLEADLLEASMWLHGSVTAKKLVDSSRKAMINSDSVKLSGINKSVYFKGNVIIDVDDMRVTGPKAEFQYDKKTKKLQSLMVKGGVKVTDKEKWATAEEVNVFLDQDKFVFSGNPRLVQNNDELRGHKIIFTKGGKKVQVFKARAKVESGNVE